MRPLCSWAKHGAGTGDKSPAQLTAAQKLKTSQSARAAQLAAQALALGWLPVASTLPKDTTPGAQRK